MEQRVSSVVAASNLLDHVTDIFRVVEPAPENAAAFGHRLRELLILLCTEVETSWKGVLVANGVKRTRMTTRDYVRLLVPLRLKEWQVRLSDYPAFGEISPFADWDPSAPTTSLAWYDAYNSVKHDRETSFPKATLGHVVSAAAALHVLQAAQWGPPTAATLSPFSAARAPAYELPDLYYARAQPDGTFTEWRRVPLNL